MAAQKLIVVVGITGNQGGSVARTYFQQPGWRVRGLTRDPSKASCDYLRDAGAELVQADLDDADAVRAACSGAKVIFGVTDFWQFWSRPETQALADSRGITLNEACAVREQQHGKNIIDAAAATVGTLDRFVLSTLSNSRKWSKGKITWNYHFDGKAAMVDYLKATHPELATKTSYYQIGIFMTNWKWAAAYKPVKQTDGSFVIRHPSILENPKQIPWVHPSRDTGTYVKALVDNPPGKTLLGFSSLLTDGEWAALWGKVNGVECRFEPMTAEQAMAEMPGVMGRELTESAIYMSEFGFDGGDPEVLHPADLGIDTTKLLSAEEYIRTEDWSSVL